MTAGYPSSSHAPLDASPLSPLVDETRLGSAGGQTVTGIAGIVLAVVLVVGQISVATTKGIAVHLHKSVEHIALGNDVMESVIERGAPTAPMEGAVAAQARTLAKTRAAMARTNTEMAKMQGTTATLDSTVARMQGTSTSLATGVTSVSRGTKDIAATLSGLPASTRTTGTSLDRISTDTNALNHELEAIGAKMRHWGLARVRGDKAE